MDLPDIVNTLVDNEKNITYKVFAYRKLTRDELVLAVRHYYAQKKKPKVKPEQTIKILLTTGHNE